MTEPSDDWIERVLAPLVDARVQDAVARHLVDASHLKPCDLIETPRIYGGERKPHLHEAAIINDALIILSSGEITLEEYVFVCYADSVAPTTDAFGTPRSLGICTRFRGDRGTSPASKEDVDLTGLRLDGVDSATAQLVRDVLSKGLFGTQDYAVVARAP